MEIRTILINVDIRRVNSEALRYAIDLATEHDSELIGVGADKPTLPPVADAIVATDLYADARREIERELTEAARTFEDLVPEAIRRQWRGYVYGAHEALISEAASADIIVTGQTTLSTFQTPEEVDVGGLALSSGRPIVSVGEIGRSNLKGVIVIAWKDTREARRAVADALPLLGRAKNVIVITLAEGEAGLERRSLDAIVAWLRRHGVNATAELLSAPQADIASIAQDRHADLVVSGAYGRSRLREWLFGGVTRTLLKSSGISCLFSH